MSGGLEAALQWARRCRCTTMQIFSRSPRGGPASALDPALVDAFTRGRRAADIDPLVVHAPYIINLASPDAVTWRNSVRLFREEVERAGAFKARYLVVHMGTPREAGEAAGVARVTAALEQTLESDGPVTVLLENSAGSGRGFGDRFEQLAAIRAAVSRPDRVGVCLDTAHLFAAGHPIHTPDGLEQVLDAFDRRVGFKHLRLLHLNDSKKPFGSRVDRHWHIGQGAIGRAAFGRLVRHPALRDLPMILETPKATEAEDRRNLAVVRRLASARAGSRGTLAAHA